MVALNPYTGLLTVDRKCARMTEIPNAFFLDLLHCHHTTPSFSRYQGCSYPSGFIDEDDTNFELEDATEDKATNEWCVFMSDEWLLVLHSMSTRRAPQ